MDQNSLERALYDQNMGRLIVTLGWMREIKKREERASIDYKTGLPNAEYADRFLRDSYVNSRRAKKPLTLIYLDINHFKKINDTLGHAAGDEFIKEVAIVLQCSISRETDRVMRLGQHADEYVIVLPYTNKQGGSTVGHKIQTAIKDYFGGKLTVAMGISTYNPRGASPITLRQLHAQADLAMYNAKMKSRETSEIVVYTPSMDKQMTSK
ncbi:MAG: GGDEF domain-containing protein [Candidatus Aenigmarchaeota archaeon]|nr:GGDEF domain-containing protein [Candidatus Aenigmarchaeota archaeon]